MHDGLAATGISLDGRNAFSDHDEVASILELSHAPVNDRAHVSIVIPTYLRDDVLLDALRSAMEQDYGGACEVVVVDNDPEGHIDDAIRDAISGQNKINVRYYRNSSNIGMFGNWNRAISLSEGEWLTVLNDDDVLSLDFVSRSLSALDALDGADGIVCRKDTFDRRTNAAAGDTAATGLRDRLRGSISALRFGHDGVRRLTPRMLYFANYPGNTAGFLFRRRVALDIGGFLPEEWPAADYMMYVRFAIRTRIFLFKPVLAHVGLGENESMRPETLIGFVRIFAGARRALAGHAVPARWSALDAQLTSNYLLDIEEAWGVRLDRSDVAAELGMALPPPDRRALLWRRLLQRAL